jgi:uncharacterized protein (DUF2336 family)
MKQNPAVLALTQEDFLNLKKSSEPYTRAAIAKKIVVHLEGHPPESQAYQLAAEIAHFLQQDKSMQVRESLAIGVQFTRAAPKEMILKLANDEYDEVAVPILRNSPLLEEEDIAEILRSTTRQARFKALAERAMVSVALSALMVEKQDEPSCVALLDNTTSQINDLTYRRIAELHETSRRILHHMMQRLPMSEQVIERMQRAQVQDTVTTESTMQMESRALSSFSAMSPQELLNVASAIVMLGENPDPDRSVALARKLHKTSMITIPTLLLSLSLGQVGFFYLLLCEVTRIPYKEFHEIESGGLVAVLVKARISPSLHALMEWVWGGMQRRLEQGIHPSSRQMARLMAIHLQEGARQGINFSSTIGIPVANVLERIA